MDNLIFDIQQFSVHDGPGIRTTVFFKGCNLRCAWCHNPESISPDPVLQLYPHKCIHCGKCIEVCPHNCNIIVDGELSYRRELCDGCGECARVCYAQSRQIAGRRWDADEIMKIVERDLHFYKSSGGGVTFSGGEPMLQHEFLLSLLEKCKEIGLHTAVDTAGNVLFERFEQVRPLVDLFLYDLKVMDDEVHKRFTGVSNRLIIENLKRLADGRSDIYIRIPVIPGVNDNMDNMRKSADLLSPLSGIKLVELLPFHFLGEAKYKSLGMEYPIREFGPLSKVKTAQFAVVFSEAGLKVKAH